MSRLGLDENETSQFISSKIKYNSLKIDLIMSHLACGDQIKHSMNNKQLNKFKIIRRHFPRSMASLANSAGIFINKKYHFDLVRPGIALYGGSPFINSKINFHHVVNLKAKVIQIRNIKKNDTIGYGGTFKAKKNMYIGTIAVGYADGLNRKFSNNMKVYLGNKPLKVLGRVSMDLMTIDLTPIYTTKMHSKSIYVDVINKYNNINVLSDKINTIPYEILTSLGNRYKRKYI
jgi:alanine racemase